MVKKEARIASRENVSKARSSLQKMIKKGKEVLSDEKDIVTKPDKTILEAEESECEESNSDNDESEYSEDDEEDDESEPEPEPEPVKKKKPVKKVRFVYKTRREKKDKPDHNDVLEKLTKSMTEQFERMKTDMKMSKAQSNTNTILDSAFLKF
jgi:hypothetical protein